MHSGRKHHVISGWLNISKYQYKQQKIVQAFYLELRSREDQKWRIESKKLKVEYMEFERKRLMTPASRRKSGDYG